MNKKLLLLALIILSVVAVAGCDSEEKKPVISKPVSTTASGESHAGKTTGIILKIDEAERTILFTEFENSEKIQYKYDVGCEITNKSGNAITMAQLHPGDLVDINADANGKITAISISNNSDIWENTKVTSFAYLPAEHAMRIGKSKYSCDDGVNVFSGDRIISVSELCYEDQLIVRGYKTKIVSIVVDKGHGYVSLTGDSLFLGGYIDIGNRVVKVIEKDMIVIVREGDYKVEVVNGKYRASKNITVDRDGRTYVDFSDIQPIVNATGNLKIDIDVENAMVYVDGNQVNHKEVLTLNVGKHTVKAIAPGYEERSVRVDVISGYQEVAISLTSSETQSASKTEQETTAEQSTTTGVVSTKNKVTISGPVGANVYFDGAYKGTAPVTFPLVTGEHVVSVLHNKEIKSYTVNLVEGSDDVVYDFTNN